MNKITFSNKFVLMIATMLPAIMLATSLTLSLVQVTAFALEDDGDSDDIQSNIRENEGGDNSVGVDSTAQTEVDVDLNIDANTHVISDEEDCDEASDEISQENDQKPTSESRSDGNVGDDSIYVSSQAQTTVLVAENINVDTDVVPEGCNPSDRVNQDNDQSPSQIAGGDVETGENPITNLQIHQRAFALAENRNVDTDATIPPS
jgi:hypothetical protein